MTYVCAIFLLFSCIGIARIGVKGTKLSVQGDTQKYYEIIFFIFYFLFFIFFSLLSLFLQVVVMWLISDVFKTVNSTTFFPPIWTFASFDL